MKINLSGIIIIVGGYGSGKTEVAINLAIEKNREGLDVRIADLDVVNLYFRTREAKDLLSEQGISVVLPPDEYLQADFPVLSPLISGIIRQPYTITLIDCGGDDAGVAALSPLAELIKEQPYHMLQVINCFRPDTGTMEGCMKIRDAIERVSTLRVTGIIGNSNLTDETTVDHIYSGYDFVKKLSDHTRLRLEFITIDSELISEVDTERFTCPVLTIDRKLVLPWHQRGERDAACSN